VIKSDYFTTNPLVLQTRHRFKVETVKKPAFVC